MTPKQTPKQSPRTCLTIYYGRSPGDIYNFVKKLSGSQGCLMQDGRNKELVVARRAISADSLDIFYTRHDGIASIERVFDNFFEKVLIQEYLELDLLQLRPLTEVELASSVSQVIGAFDYLARSCPQLVVDEVRVSLTGKVKLVLDFGFGPRYLGPTTDKHWHKAFFDLVESLKPESISFLGHAFFQCTTPDRMPPLNHGFLLLRSQGPRGLVLTVRRACGVQLAGFSDDCPRADM